MKKICHMTSAHAKEDIRIFRKECTSLARAGYEVYLVERGESYEKNGVHIVGVGEIPNSRLRRMIFGAKQVYKKALLLDCDLYHIHDPELLPYGLKLKRKGKKVVFDSHELTRAQILHKPYLPMRTARVISFLYSLYENRVLRKLDAVIFPCPINGEFPLPGKRQVMINNLPWLSEMYDKYDSHAAKEHRTACTLGSLSYDRGIKHLILAAAKADCKVILGGSFISAEFEREIMSMPESKNVEYLGYLNREQVISVYEHTEICVSALLNIGQYSVAENLSTKVYECLAMGLPVILSKQSFNEEMVARYQFGICVDPEDVDGFASAIRSLIDHPETIKRMGENGRKLIKEKLNWETEQKKLMDLYDDILLNDLA
jgi:glycosyltransferase involved in cell wall biosynthesis